MRRELFALIGMVIGMILIVMAFFVPWYSTMGSIGTETMSSDIYLQRATTNSPITGEISMDYEGREGVEYITNTMYLTIGALIMAILSLIGIFGIYFKFGNVKNMRKIGFSFGILTFILAIISIFYFMMGTLDTMQKSSDIYYSGTGQTPLGGSTPGFWSNMNVMGMEMSTGPGFAWYIMIIAGLIALISSILLLKKPAPELSSVLETTAEKPDE